MFRRIAKAALAGAAHRTGADKLLGHLKGSTRVPLILGYHNVVEDFAASAAGYMPSMLISRAMLEQQLDWLGRRYRFISLDELGEQLERGEPFEKPTVAITFDDGYRDFYELAFPLLQRKGIPSAIFVVTDLVGTSRLQVYDKLYLLLARAFSPGRAKPFDLLQLLDGLGTRQPDLERLRHPEQDPYAVMRALYTVLPRATLLRVIERLEACVGIDERTHRSYHAVTWDMLATVSRAGVTIGSHTMSHSVLPNEDWAGMLEQTAGSRHELERRLRIPIRHFAYANGSFNAAAVAVVADAGYRFAYTTCVHRDSRYPQLTIPRRLLWEQSCVDPLGRFSPSIMSSLIHGLFDFADRCVQNHGWPKIPVAIPQTQAATPRGARQPAEVPGPASRGDSTDYGTASHPLAAAASAAKTARSQHDLR